MAQGHPVWDWNEDHPSYGVRSLDHDVAFVGRLFVGANQPESFFISVQAEKAVGAGPTLDHQEAQSGGELQGTG